MASVALVGGPPPSPPTSTEGDIFSPTPQIEDIYPPVPAYAILSTAPESGELPDDLRTPPQTQPVLYTGTHSSYYSRTGDYSSSMPTSCPMPLSDLQDHTPPAITDDNILLVKEEHSSPSVSSQPGSPPRFHIPTTKALKTKASNSSRVRKPKAKKKSPRKEINITQPLSVLTKGGKVPPKDLTAWAHRSKEERLREAQEKGKISRPMNAFIFYRSAYTSCAMEYLKGENHQDVSKITGASWNLEPPSIRAIYEDLAKTDREMHELSHPDYKFRPCKGPATTRQSEMTPPASTAPGPVTDPATPLDFEEGEYPLASSLIHPHQHTPSHRYVYARSSRGSTPHQTPEPRLVSNGFMSPPWPSGVYTPHGLPMEAGGLHTIGSQMGGMLYREASPMLQHPLSHSSDGIAGIPGLVHRDLLQPQEMAPLPMHQMENSNVDPQLMTYQKDYGGIQNISGATLYQGTVPQVVPHWGEETFLTTAAPSQTPSPAPPPGAMSAYAPYMHHDPSYDAKFHDLMPFEGASVDLDQWFEHHASGL
ncbi:hypothetical protein N7462_007647 [Penicillium macrosclerotiorum]|uniref:uncharacterized protein n=1 Tax=Penicillium macrosclerotiorum TaxID=303699 RepID=UPI0025495D39|nr:uncharacterized protein N7462_007647 [Penicillium macrosclerotiorum]KAJ5679403.1 hypothetical protein N7462_007647 [Penicillium macrosclerotiorum]